jgi:hypothetical protein
MRQLMAAIRKRDGAAAWLAASAHVQKASEAALAQIDLLAAKEVLLTQPHREPVDDPDVE